MRRRPGPWKMAGPPWFCSEGATGARPSLRLPLVAASQLGLGGTLWQAGSRRGQGKPVLSTPSPPAPCPPRPPWAPASSRREPSLPAGPPEFLFAPCWGRTAPVNSAPHLWGKALAAPNNPTFIRALRQMPRASNTKSRSTGTATFPQGFGVHSPWYPNALSSVGPQGPR